MSVPERRYSLDEIAHAGVDLQVEEGYDPATINAVFVALCRRLVALDVPPPPRPALAAPAPPRPARPPVATSTGPAAPARPQPRALQQATFTLPDERDAQLSPYQRAILDYLGQTESGDVLIDAVAGSGKTSTLVAIARHLQGDALFLAFNKHVVTTMAKRLEGRQGLTVSTGHRIGKIALQAAFQVPQLKPLPFKYPMLCRKLVDTDRPQLERPLRARAIDGLREWADYCRLTLTDPIQGDQVLQMVRYYGLEDGPELLEDLLSWLPEVMAQGETLAQDEHQIDFTDMLYLPVRWQLTPLQAPWVLVDECQDLSAALLQLVLSCRAPGGRILFVGDGYQAINGFAGADPASMVRIEAHTQARRFPLPICYRCPTSHVDLAKAHVPHLEARPDAPVGTIVHLKEDELAQHVKVGDLILCRSTVPLLRWAFDLMRAGLPVAVRGHDLSDDLTGLIQAVARREGFTFATFGHYLEQHEQDTLARLRQRAHADQAVEQFEDRCLAVRVCYEHLGAKTVPDLVKKVKHLFQEQAGRVTLSTVHRAKGDEAARVFVLDAQKLPLTWPEQQDWEYQQEQHIRYVALTRATDTLFLVDA